MSIVRIGPTKQYADGWEIAFGKGKSAKKSVAPVKRARVAKKKAGRKKK